ncbi:hypothetical protein MJ904_10435 [Massilia sp. MB5]|uniref:DUF6966 domain-containing protein n=1 Tax=Massilia sp. MB5 TaxID=2919578 RepID=UPI001F0E200E|nr:hypothetical protein [Massilia sp. MB5]UMR32555.1 hypothetical protein MJ904_10435 [Massilia sp. MB5]
MLTKLASLLEADDERHWSAWVLRDKALLENSDYSGIEYVLGAYGGMGSFNDFVAGQTTIDGKFAWKPGYAELNEEIDALRSKAWSLANAIKRNHEIESAYQ